MQNLISCDWGTSALRLRIINIDKVTVLAETVSSMGISTAFDLWKQSGKHADERLSFYQSILAEHTRKLEEQLDFSLRDVQLIVSGMASSSIGMMELPYKETPIGTDGHDLYIKIIEATDYFRHAILLISGVKTLDDAMRGEETQLTGCLNGNDKDEQLFVFPGTHSKHILVKNGQVIDIKTYMTGEFFDILSKKSILSVSVEEGDGLINSNNRVSFEKGITNSAQSNLLHTGFLVRTNDLFGKSSKQENYYYLSGLLIGTELREVIKKVYKKITLVVNEEIKPFYITALKILGVEESKDSLIAENADMALIKGQLKIWKNLG